MNIIAHEDNLKKLTKIVSSRIKTPILFTGIEGVGKYTVALWFAMVVNCSDLSLGEIAVPCGRCLSCRKILSSSHPDVKVILPDPKTSNIRIEHIRELHNDSLYLPLEARFKVFIVKDAHRMLDGAANAYLKLLEEPPPYMIHILTSLNSRTLLPTIISRCSIYRFVNVGSERIKECLISTHGLDDEKAEIIASISQGSPGKAFAYVVDEGFWELRESLYSQFSSLPGGELSTYASTFAELLAPEDPRKILELSLLWLRDLLVAAGDGKRPVIINKDYYEEIAAQAGKIPLPRIVAALDEVNTVINYMNFQVSPLLSADSFLKKSTAFLQAKID